MQFFQFPDKDISVRDGELRFAKFADGVEHIERPAALFDSDFFEGFDAPEFCSDLAFRAAWFSLTTAIRASMGIRCSAMLQPIQPARRAVTASGFRLMMADGGNANVGMISRFLWHYPNNHKRNGRNASSVSDDIVKLAFVVKGVGLIICRLTRHLFSQQ